MGASTKINDLITMALRRHDRRNTEVTDILKAKIKVFIKEEICTIFPFWFLRLEVGAGFLTSEFPLSQDDLDNASHISIPNHSDVTCWLDRGILRTEEGVAQYPLAGPAETPVGDRTGSYWSLAKFQKPLYVKPISLKGSVGPELPIQVGQVFLENNYSSVQGAPCFAYFESGREGDYIRLSPTPDRAYLLAVSWVLAEPLDYFLSPGDVVANNYTNKFLQEHEEVYSYIVMLKAAEYFNDAPNIEFYRNALFGDMNRSVGKIGGKLGDLKRSHQRRARQAASSIPIWKSNPMQVGTDKMDAWGRRAGGAWRA